MKDRFALIVDKKIEGLIKKHSAPDQKQARNGACFYAETSLQKDVFLKATGLKDYNQILEFVYDFIHPTLETPLIDVWGKHKLKSSVDDLIRRKRRNTKAIAKELLNSRLPKWRVFFPLYFMTLDFKIDLSLANLHPPGAAFFPANNHLRTDHPEINQLPYLEIKECRGANEDMVPVVAMEHAKFVLSLIPSGSEGLMLKTAPYASETMVLVQNIATGSWRYTWSIGHRGVTYSSKASHEVKRAKALTVQANKINYRIKEGSQISKRLKNAAIMFQTAKTTTDGTSKLLLLASCLDTLLMEKYYPNSHTSEFKKRLSNYLNVYPHKMSKPERHFFEKLYKVRSDIVHASHRHQARHKDYLNAESVVYSLLLEFNQHKGKSQLQVLRKICVIK
jgi:hypothetical protein